MVDQINDKQGLISFLKQRMSDKYNQNELEHLKNVQRLNASMAVFCGQSCLTDFGDRTLLPNEALCLTNCARRFYDEAELGDKLNKL